MKPPRKGQTLHKQAGGEPISRKGGEAYSYPWDRVLRHPDAAVRKKLADLSIAAANNGKVGCDRSQRATYWIQLEAAGYHTFFVSGKRGMGAGVTALTLAEYLERRAREVPVS